MSRDPAVRDCPIAATCGGCASIGEPAAAQLEVKRRRVAEAFAAFAPLAAARIGPCRAAAEPFGYRNRAKLAVIERDGRVVAGLRRRGSGDVVDLAPCVVQRPALLRHTATVAAWLGRNRLVRPAGPVKAIDVREAADDAWHLTLVVHAERPPAGNGWPLDELRELAPGLLGVSINANPHESSFVFGALTRTVCGARSFPVDVPGPDGADRRFEVPAGGFFQVALEPLAFVHDAMRSHLGDRGPLLDLYCGVGLHGLTLAALAGEDARTELVGVEAHPAATACARRNADRLGVPARFHTGNVERLLGTLPDAPRVVLNPGRSGCRPAVLDSLGARPGRRLAYLSCAPDTLARDLARLLGRGWRLERTVPIDLMPQTDHVETLALLGDG